MDIGDNTSRGNMIKARESKLWGKWLLKIERVRQEIRSKYVRGVELQIQRIWGNDEYTDLANINRQPHVPRADGCTPDEFQIFDQNEDLLIQRIIFSFVHKSARPSQNMKRYSIEQKFKVFLLLKLF